MTAITVSTKNKLVSDELKIVAIRTDAAANTGFTYDTNMDASDGRGVEFSEIFDAYHVGATGTRVNASLSNSTGVVTLGTVAGGPASVQLIIIGK